MLNAIHSVEKRMGELEGRQSIAERDNAQHREDDRLAFAGLHTAIIDLGDSQSRQFSGMLDVVRHRVDSLILAQEKAESYAAGVKDARKPSATRLAIIQGIAGNAVTVAAGILGALLVAAGGYWLHDQVNMGHTATFIERPQHVGTIHP